jgi:hypothetical protein
MTQAGGENAHNYFLQTFAEVRLLGIFCILLVFLYPIQRRQQNKRYLVAVFGILAIFYGNIYSHSLIIRENLFFLVAMIALLYVFTVGFDSEKSARHKTSCYFFIKGSVVFLLLLLLFFFGLAEMSGSFDKAPFTPFH